MDAIVDSRSIHQREVHFGTQIENMKDNNDLDSDEIILFGNSTSIEEGFIINTKNNNNDLKEWYLAEDNNHKKNDYKTIDPLSNEELFRGSYKTITASVINKL